MYSLINLNIDVHYFLCSEQEAKEAIEPPKPITSPSVRFVNQFRRLQAKVAKVFDSIGIFGQFYSLEVKAFQHQSTKFG